ncbi:MAG: UDP-3-O-(3-hydroxymyristoyl)glucosamine N-acyltransferase [Candidatus Kapaibacterium sp.]
MKSFHLSLAQIADIVSGRVVGDAARIVTSVARIEDAGPDSITFLSSKNFERYHADCKAACIMVDENRELLETEGRAYIVCTHPHRAFVRLIEQLSAMSERSVSVVHPTAVIAVSAIVDASVSIGAYAVIGENVTIGAGTVIEAACIIGDDVRIGSRCHLHPHVVIEHECVVGDRCIIHAHAVLGSDGFGYLENADGSFDKIPQVGNVVVHDDVEIGAGTCIDRAALGSTVIGHGVKLDNHVHIAHNAVIKADTAIAAQSAIAGGTVIGKRNRLGGQVGVVGYVETADNVILGAQSGVSKSIVQAGVYSGSPAMELKQRLKQEAVMRRLARDA